MDNERRCENCKFGCLFDYGYSNYTVEGTEFFYSKAIHPDGHFDAYYGQDKRLEYARQCQGYEAGKAILMDVECDGECELTPEQRSIYDQARAMR